MSFASGNCYLHSDVLCDHLQLLNLDAAVSTSGPKRQTVAMDRPVPDGAVYTSLPGRDSKLGRVQFDLENLPLPSAPLHGHMTSAGDYGCAVSSDPDPGTDSLAEKRLDWATPAPHRQLRHFRSSGSMAAGSLQQGGGFEQWEPLIRSKDSILQQKDVTIHRLQREVSLLQQQCHDSEVRMQQVIRKQMEGDSALLSVKLSETQNDLALAHVEAEQARKQAEKDVSVLQATLGRAEYELQECQRRNESFRVQQESYEAKSKQIAAEHEEVVGQWTSALQESEHREEALKQRVQSLEHYLTKVPTPQEVQRNANAVSLWREKCEQAEQQCSEAQHSSEEKQLELDKQGEELEQLRAQVSALLQLQSDRIQEQFEVTTSCSKGELHAALLQREAQCAEFRTILEKSKTQAADDMQKVRHRYKQLYARATADLQKECLKVKQSVDELNVCLAEEKVTTAALKGDISERQAVIAELRSTTSQLLQQNQDLLDHNFRLEQAQMEQANDARFVEYHDQIQRIQTELDTCVTELGRLMQVWKNFLQGRDPDMSQLLGLPAVSSDQPSAATSYGSTGASTEEDFSVQLDQQLTGIKSLRSDVDKLRSLLADQYAQELGTSCPIQ